MIRISILQWLVEILNIFIFFTYIIYFSGWNLLADKFFNLYSLAFGIIIQPAFYVGGDVQFRTTLANKGVLHAVKLVFK